MTEHNPAGSPAKKQVPFAARLARLGRMAACLLTAGMMYPNVFVENLDPTEIQGRTAGDLKKKQ